MSSVSLIRGKSVALFLLIPLLMVLTLTFPALAQAAVVLPPNFSEDASYITTGLNNPTAMEFAPDGRLFVCEQGGTLKVFSSTGASLGAFMSLPAEAPLYGEQGLLGIAFDPDFATNHFLYVYYTFSQNGTRNRVSRFKEDPANPNRMLPGSEVIILELDTLSSQTNHNGGAIHFGPIGQGPLPKLYVAVGDNNNTSNAQVVTNRLGKILRINKDGTIPSDNPTTLPIGSGTVTPTGANRAIWAMGFRNPFTFAVQPGTGRILINDVGASSLEEINDLVKGSNYGWGGGSTDNPAYKGPIHEYAYNPSNACSIIGGTFYNPATPQFPSPYLGKYFFRDYCGDWIRMLDLSNNTVTGFATGAHTFGVDMKVDSSGALYTLSRASDAAGARVSKITYDNPVDNKTVASFMAPASGATLSGTAVTVTVIANDPDIGSTNGAGIATVFFELLQGTTILTNPPSFMSTTTPYTWIFNSTALANGNYSIRARATSSAAAGGSSIAITRDVTISNERANTPPVATILTPIAGTTYNAGNAGQAFSYSGSATDTQDGNLSASQYTWRVDFHHNTHVHPFITDTMGSTTGSFTIPPQSETGTFWYRISLTVGDSGGLTTTVTRDIMPIVNAPPTLPILVFPATGELGLGTTTIFLFKPSTDPEGSVVTYTLCLRKNDAEFVPAENCTAVQTASRTGNGISYAGMGTVLGTGILLFGITVFGRLFGKWRSLFSALIVVSTGFILFSCGGGGGTTPPITNEVSVSRSGLDPTTQYFWKVVAKDTNNNTQDSEIRSFTTQ